MLTLKPKNGESLLIEGLSNLDNSFSICQVTDHEKKVRYLFTSVQHSENVKSEKADYVTHCIEDIEVTAFSNILGIESTGTYQLPISLLTPVPFSFDKNYLRTIFNALAMASSNSKLGLVNELEDPSVLGL